MDARPEDNGNYNMASLVLRPLDLERGERLLYRLTEFGRLLWEVGINVGPRQMLDLAETLDYIDVTNQVDFYDALKCSLLSRHEQMFDYFWFRRDKQGKKDNAPGTVKREERQMRLPPSERKRLAEHLNTSEVRKELRAEMRETERRRKQEDRNQDDDNDDTGNPQGTAYSAIERLTKKDFENFTWDEVQEAKKLMAEMRWNLGMRRTRRKAPARSGSYPDMRRIVRRNLKYGAELLELTWRETKYKPRPLVIVCDISGSMSLYSRLLLHFIHTISNGLMNVEALRPFRVERRSWHRSASLWHSQQRRCG